MGDHSNIEWTDASWTPIRARNRKTGKVGWHCEHATTGCEFCYAESMNRRLGTGLPFKPGHRNDIDIFLDDEMLTAPLRWRKPRMIFVCSMTDAFADFVKDEWLDQMFAVMALCPQHTFQVLTKRSERMRSYTSQPNISGITDAFADLFEPPQNADEAAYILRAVIAVNEWPLPNVWLGVSCERQAEADERIPHLLATPAAIRFVSAEPLLGPIDFSAIPMDSEPRTDRPIFDPPALHWVIVGGESGPKARPMHWEWAQDIRFQCRKAGVAFFFKQWGEWAPRWPGDLSEGMEMERVGKKRAGRLLDGREHNDFPVTEKHEAAA